MRITLIAVIQEYESMWNLNLQANQTFTCKSWHLQRQINLHAKSAFDGSTAQIWINPELPLGNKFDIATTHNPQFLLSLRSKP